MLGKTPNGIIGTILQISLGEAHLMAFADITSQLQLSSTLFYGAIDRCYVLRLDPEHSDPKDLRYAGNLADEYGTRIFDYSLSYYREYFSCIAEDDALEKLRSVR